MKDTGWDYSRYFWQGEKVRLRPLRVEDAERSFINSLDSPSRRVLQFPCQSLQLMLGPLDPSHLSNTVRAAAQFLFLVFRQGEAHVLGCSKTRNRPGRDEPAN